MNSINKRIHWIFFDLDDTIWDFSANSIKSLRILYDNSPVLKKYFKTFEELNKEYHIHNSLLWDALAKGLIKPSELKIERWRRTIASRTFEVLTAVCEELDSTYLDILASMPNNSDDVLNTLEKLSKEFLLGVLSNGFRKTQYKKINSASLQKYITRMVISEEIGVAKPDKRFFDYALNETGAVAPYLMIGDNLEADILGAMKSGWHAIWINPAKNLFPDNEYLEKEGINPNLFLGSVENIQDTLPLIDNFFNQPK